MLHNEPQMLFLPWRRREKKINTEKQTATAAKVFLKNGSESKQTTVLPTSYFSKYKSKRNKRDLGDIINRIT